MTTLLAFHEVDDVDQDLGSAHLAAGRSSVSYRSRDAARSATWTIRIGSADPDVPDMAAFQEAMESEGGRTQ